MYTSVHMQVAPSFFDAPGTQAAGRVNAISPKQTGMLNPERSPVSNARFVQDQPELAFAYVSDFGYKVSCCVLSHLCTGFLIRRTLLHAICQ